MENKETTRSLMLADYVDILDTLLDNLTTRHIIIETPHTIHHIERMSTTCRDRGQYKWLVELKASAQFSADDEAKRSHVDDADMFPRYFYLKSSVIAEVMQFIIIRALTILNIVSAKS